MEALFGKRGNRLRTNPDAVEFALDLTAEAIILHECAAHGRWKKFASAQLDDPEFPIVIGLLRSEAETQAGGREPVRLWLPGEQVLKRRARPWSISAWVSLPSLSESKLSNMARWRPPGCWPPEGPPW